WHSGGGKKAWFRASGMRFGRTGCLNFASLIGLILSTGGMRFPYDHRVPRGAAGGGLHARLKPEGRFLMHIFTHRSGSYLFDRNNREERTALDWLANFDAHQGKIEAVLRDV